MWIEINPANPEPGVIREFDIAPKPLEEMEVRISVLNCKDVAIMDWEGTTDAFFKGFFNVKEEVQETDTHWRSQDGKPDFEYRLVFRVKIPRKDNVFTL
jgi:hypothetical protein